MDRRRHHLLNRVSEFLVLKIRRTEKPEHFAEQVRVVAVIETKLKFIEIAINMLHADLMIRTNDGSFEQRPDVLKRIRAPVRARIRLCRGQP